MLCMLGHLLMGQHSSGHGQEHGEKEAQTEIAALREEIRALREALQSQAKGRPRRRSASEAPGSQHPGH